MNTNIIFIGGTGHHAMLAWLLCQGLYGVDIEKKKMRLFFIDSDSGTSRVNSIYKKMSAIGFSNKDEYIIKKNIPSEIAARITLKDYLEKNNKIDDEIFFEDELLEMDVTTGFHGYPIVGAAAALLEFNTENVEDYFKDKDKQNVEKIIIVGSSIGGTGSGIGPALKECLYTFKRKKGLPTKIILIYYVGYLKIEERESETDLTYELEEIELKLDERPIQNGHPGDFKSNSDAAMAYYSKRLFYVNADEVAFVGTPKGFIEYRTDDGLMNQNDRCTIIHLILANLIDYYIFNRVSDNSNRKCKIFQVINQDKDYVINMSSDIRAFHFPNKLSLDYFILTRVAYCLEIVLLIKRYTNDLMEGKSNPALKRALNKAQGELRNSLNILKELDEIFRRSEKTILSQEMKGIKIESDLFNIFKAELYEPNNWGKWWGKKNQHFLHFLDLYKQCIYFVDANYHINFSNKAKELNSALAKIEYINKLINSQKLGGFDRERVRTDILNIQKLIHG